MKRSIALFAALALGALAAPLAAVAQPYVIPAAVPIPRTCNASPVYGRNSKVHNEFAYVRALPSFSPISMKMLYAPISNGAYAPVPAGGALVEWVVRRSSFASNSVIVTARRAGSRDSFRRTFPLAPNATLTFPKPGCWHLSLQSGVERGEMTLWVVRGSK